MKQQITKNAIETAFLKLLKERNFEKVMVKDIVEECGLTRNTFYYYYEDTYNIITDILEREIRRILEEVENGKTFLDAAKDSFEYLEENKRIAKHLLASAKKDEMYAYISSAVEIILRRWIDRQTGAGSIPEADKRAIIKIHCYVIQGILSDWVQTGMKDSLTEEVRRVQVLFSDVLKQAMENSQNKNPI